VLKGVIQLSNPFLIKDIAKIVDFIDDQVIKSKKEFFNQHFEFDLFLHTFVVERQIMY
jgi:hypothetical protein